MEPAGIIKGAYETPDMSRIVPKANSGRKNPSKSAPVKSEESQTSEQEEEEDPQPSGHTLKSSQTDNRSGTRRRPGRRDSIRGYITTPVKSIESGVYDESAGSGSFYCDLKMFFVVVFLAVAIIYWTYSANHPSAPTLSIQLNLMNVGLEELIQEFPDQKNLLQSFKKSINDTLTYGSQPATILVTSEETHRTRLDCFLRRLMRVLAQVMNTSPEIEGITAESFPDRDGLQSRLLDSLAKNQVVCLKDVHKVSGNTALALHAICDNEHAPVKKAVVILTVTGPGLQSSEVDVDGVLKKAWQPELGVDKYSPIFSRISGFFVHFKPDSEKISQYCKQ